MLLSWKAKKWEEKFLMVGSGEKSDGIFGRFVPSSANGNGQYKVGSISCQAKNNQFRERPFDE